MQPRPYSFFIALVIILGVFFNSPSAYAGKVVKVKGKKIYIKLDADEVDRTFKGDKLYLTLPSGKKKGIVVVKKMKGRLIIAKLGKGKAKKGYFTVQRKSKRKKKKPLKQMEDASEVAQTDSETERSNMMLGVIGTFGTASQEVNQLVDMSGSTTGFKGIFDYELFSDLGVQARLGIEQLAVTGSTGSLNFETTISYITLDLLLRYYLYRGESLGFFVNGGMGIYSPMSTDLTGGSDPSNPGAIQEDSISTTSLLVFGAGLSIPLGGWEIQLGADYLFFPPSDDVKTTVINGKIGLLFEI